MNDFDDEVSSRASLADGLMHMAEITDDIQAMVTARRDSLIADGFSPTAAEDMAMAMWHSLWRGIA